jgi:ethanolamine permease
VTSAAKTPARALILGGAVGLIVAFIIDINIAGPVGAALLNMAVMGAVISYSLVMIDYIVLKKKRPDLNRPYKSPLGIPGAVVGTVLALAALISTFAIEAYRFAVIATAVFLVLMFGYYWFFSRHQLVARAPEEEAALVKAAQAELR